jgi:glycosyltransferase involved in cell wall biosynthesis
MTQQVCLVPYLHGLGGMVSFQGKFIQGLEKFNVEYTFDLSDPRNDAILVVGGTRQVPQLLKAKKRGVRIVQRLNGMNWLHRVEQTPIKSWVRGETANMLLSFIRKSICDRIIYQSEFSRWWWEDRQGILQKPCQVIHNGINLDEYSPAGPEKPPEDQYRILMVEGHLSGLYSRGLDVASQLVVMLQNMRKNPIELSIAGDVPETLKLHYQQKYPDIMINWSGVIPQEQIPALDRSAHLLYSADLNAACPNSVIEALACGLPVLAFDTGALAELVTPDAGSVVPYGGDHWKLDPPDIPALAQAALPILEQNTSFRQAARRRAEAAFDLDDMTRAYLEVLLG